MTTMMRRLTAVLAGAVLVLALAGSALGATSTVRAKGEKWKPVHTFIGRGDRVTFSNPTNTTHDVKGSGGLRLSSVLSPGDRVTKTFRKAGTFRFRCVRHSAMVGGRCRGMCGLVHVVA
jgi:plastocyanin